MAFLTFIAIINRLFLLTLVVELFIRQPLGVGASPVTSRHRRAAANHRLTEKETPEFRPFPDPTDYVDSWDELLDDDFDDESSNDGNDDPSEQKANDADRSAPGESTSNHHRRFRELNEALTSRMLREQRLKRRRTSHRDLAISAIQALTNNLQSRAVCGWTYRNNHDIKRIPVDLPEAVCSSEAVAGTRNLCEQVYYSVPVRELGVSSKGIMTWSAGWIALKVGCTLATAGTVPYSGS